MTSWQQIRPSFSLLPCGKQIPEFSQLGTSQIATHLLRTFRCSLTSFSTDTENHNASNRNLIVYTLDWNEYRYTSFSYHRTKTQRSWFFASGRTSINSSLHHCTSFTPLRDNVLIFPSAEVPFSSVGAYGAKFPWFFTWLALSIGARSSQSVPALWRENNKVPARWGGAVRVRR